MQAIIISAEDKNDAPICYFGNCPALFLCSWRYLRRPINNFSGQSGSARMVAGSRSSTSLTSCVSALNCADLHQIWLSSQTGAVSSLKENLVAVFTGVHIYILKGLNVCMSICFFLKLSWVTWKQVLFLIFTSEELVYVCLRR